jgi:RNA polymerase sigma factor (sigma-70 family)
MALTVHGAEPRSRPGQDDIAARALAVAQRTAFGVLGDRESAADVAQEVALQAVRRHHTLRRQAALEGWVARIAVRAAIREARKSRRRRAAEEVRQDVRAEYRHEELDDTLALLDGLPPAQRAALVLRYVHDLPDGAIARALRCRPNTVPSLLSRGRAAVRTRLEEESRCP